MLSNDSKELLSVYSHGDAEKPTFAAASNMERCLTSSRVDKTQVTLNHFFEENCRALRPNRGDHLPWLDSLQTGQNVMSGERAIEGRGGDLEAAPTAEK
jgi:hypothetical protein